MKRKNKRNRFLIAVSIFMVAIVLVVVGAYGALVITSGSGEASQDIGEAVTGLESAGGVIYDIIAEQSEVRFSVNEVLNGADVTAVGTTNQIGGQITVDINNPANSQIGEIIINARTLETDRSQRNRALRSFILQSSQDEYEFITFTPTDLSGLPTTAIEAGQPITFQIMGDLTIVDTTRSVTFDAEVTLNADNTISGSASTIVQYPDFGLTIPRVPSVASVEDDVLLELDFVAASAE